MLSIPARTPVCRRATASKRRLRKHRLVAGLPHRRRRVHRPRAAVQWLVFESLPLRPERGWRARSPSSCCSACGSWCQSLRAACACGAGSRCARACSAYVSCFFGVPAVIVTLLLGLLCPRERSWSRASLLCCPCCAIGVHPFELLPSEGGRARVWLCDPPVR